jgi:hypothetical protein
MIKTNIYWALFKGVIMLDGLSSLILMTIQWGDIFIRATAEEESKI